MIFTSFSYTLWYFGASVSRMMKFGHIAIASVRLMPTFIPSFFASYDAAMTQHSLDSRFVTPIGTPRRCGCACCSVVANALLRSMCMIKGFSGLILSYMSPLQHAHKYPSQPLSIELQAVI